MAYRRVRVVHQLPLHFRRPARCGGEGQVFDALVRLVQLARVGIGEGVLEMQRVDGVHVDAGLEAQQTGVTLRVGVGQITRNHLLGQPVHEDVVVDAVAEQ